MKLQCPYTQKLHITYQDMFQELKIVGTYLYLEFDALVAGINMTN